MLQDIESVEVIFSLKNTVIPESLPEPYTQLARYRYADSTTEWLPCAIKYRYQYQDNDDLDDRGRTHHESTGFGVTFKRYPNGKQNED